MKIVKAASIFLILSLSVFSCSSTKEIKKPPQLTYDYPVLSKAIKYEGNQGIPVNPTATFSTDDTEAIASVKLKNLSEKHTLRWDWYDPDGKLYYSTGNSPIKVSSGRYLREATAWHKISIRGEKAARTPGDWKVNVYLDNEFIASKGFKIQPTLAAVEIDVDVNIPKTRMENPDAIALVIGNRDYQHKDVPDAEVMKQYLMKTLGYREGNILFETDATKAKFETLLGIAGDHRGLLHDYIKPGRSDIFIFYSGHGAPDPNTRKGYFVPVDCDPAKVALNGYSLDTFYENLAKLEARNITVVIDACFSGGSSPGKLLIHNASPVGIVVNNPAIAREDTVVLASSKGNQISSWYEEKGHSLFTYFFLKALGGSADKNKDDKLTFAEIYDFVSDRAEGVPYWARRLHGGRVQTPDMQGINKDRVLVRYR
jgi:hypothetical protein